MIVVKVIMLALNCLLIMHTIRCQAAAIANVSAAANLTASPQQAQQQASINNSKLKRETKVSALEHLDTQETIDYHHLAPAAPVHHSSYHQPASSAESDYGYDADKNSYGKQASDWSLYDQGNHGLYDKYGDKAWKDHGHNAHSAHGKHDSYGNSYNSHGAGHGSGYYSRDRGYGYEKHYAYDKEVASKHHSDSHNNYGSQHGLHDHYGNSASNSHSNAGHDKYGQASRYGNHGYGKRGSNLAAHHDYGHNANKGHYYSSQAAPYLSNNYHSSYSSHVPTYRSTYSDYGPQIGYPSSYPSANNVALASAAPAVFTRQRLGQSARCRWFPAHAVMLAPQDSGWQTFLTSTKWPATALAAVADVPFGCYQKSLQRAL